MPNQLLVPTAIKTLSSAALSLCLPPHPGRHGTKPMIEFFIYTSAYKSNRGLSRYEEQVPDAEVAFT